MRSDVQKGWCPMPSRFPKKTTLVLAGLLLAVPAQSFARPHGARGHGVAMRGTWQGGYGYRPGYIAGYPVRQGYAAYRGYPAYGGYRPYGAYGYPVYGGYPGYYYGHHNHYNDAWIAVVAGLVGVVLGAMVAQPRVYRYPYPQAAYPQQPQMQQCPDGSTIPVGAYCPAPQAPAQPPPAEPPVPRG